MGRCLISPHDMQQSHACSAIGVAGSFSEGGQPFHPAKIQSFPATIFSCQEGGQVLHFCPAKLPFLSCQAPISVLPRSHFCPAKVPFLAFQGPISVLPSSHFCPAKLPISVLP